MDSAYATSLKRIHTPKGDILHGLKCSEKSFKGLGEVYFSYIKHGEVKGWKRHRRMTMNLIVVVGEIEFVVCENLSDNNQSNRFILSPDTEHKYKRLTIPPMLWLAFKGIGVTDNLVLNLASEEHDPAEAETVRLEEVPYQSTE